MGGAGAGASSGGRNAWEAASLVCRIATVGLSLASAIMTAASTKCLYRSDGSPAGAVSYSDYGSFKYSALANLLSAALQGLAIWLEVVGKEKWAKTVNLIDKMVLALTSTSAPLLLAVDNITSCGGGGRRGGGRRFCSQAGSFCQQLRFASLPSLGSVGFSVAVEYTSWRAARVDSVEGAGQPSERRRAGAPPRGRTVTVLGGTGGGGGGVIVVDDGDGGGGGGGGGVVEVDGGDGGGGGGGGQAQSQGITSDKDPKGKGKSGETSGGGEGGGGNKPEDEGIKGENKEGRGEIIVKGGGEGAQMEGTTDRRRLVPERERLPWTGHDGAAAANNPPVPQRKRLTTRHEGGEREGEGRQAGREVEVEDHREEEEIHVKEAGPAVPPGVNAIAIRRTRG